MSKIQLGKKVQDNLDFCTKPPNQMKEHRSDFFKIVFKDHTGR